MIRSALLISVAAFFVCCSRELPADRAINEFSGKQGKTTRSTFVFESEPAPAGVFMIEFEYSPRIGDGKVSVNTGSTIYELPLSLSFLGIKENVARINYAVPAEAGKDGKIRFDLIIEGDAGIKISGIRITERFYGFSAENDAAGKGRKYFATPYTARVFSPGLCEVYLETQTLPEEPVAMLYTVRSASPVSVESVTGMPSGDGHTGETVRNGFTKVESPYAGSLSLPSDYLAGGNIIRFKSESEITSAFYRAAPAQYSGYDSNDLNAPIPADPGLILAWPISRFRNPRREIFRWDTFPSILIFDFIDYDTQSKYLKRLAFFTEKAGFRGRLASNEEIADLHGWNAHDYSAVSLAAFFDKARNISFALNPEEEELREILTQNGIIREANGKIIPGDGAIISISRESQGYLRALFTVHEAYHAIYFIDEDFRKFCKERWNNFDREAKKFLLSYFQFQAYDIKDSNLVKNEFMGHIMQQPVSSAGEYFGKTLPNRMIAKSPHRESSLPAESEIDGKGVRFWPHLSRIFTEEAQAFSDYAYRRWGLAAGRVKRLSATSSGN